MSDKAETLGACLDVVFICLFNVFSAIGNPRACLETFSGENGAFLFFSFFNRPKKKTKNKFYILSFLLNVLINNKNVKMKIIVLELITKMIFYIFVDPNFRVCL